MLQKLLYETKILVIDDEVSNTQLIESILAIEGYRNVRSLNDSRGVLSLLVEFQPDLVILDLNMPYVNGFQILSTLRPLSGHSHYLPILVVSAEGSVGARCRALQSGAMDFIVKPFLAAEVVLRVRNLLTVRLQQLELENRNRALQEEVVQRTLESEEYQLELRQAQMEVVARLARAAEQRDDDTAHHTQRVALTCSLLAQGLGLPDGEVSVLRLAAPLHDVGKIGIPDAILLKPGELTEGEAVEMRRHCLIGAGLLSGGHSNLVATAERIALSHHERWNGSGYPKGLIGEDIPIEGRVVAVADVFDALTHSRPYKDAWSIERAVEEIAREQGQHFDPEVVEVFMGLPHGELV